MPKSLTGMKNIVCNVQCKKNCHARPLTSWMNTTHYIDPCETHIDEKQRKGQPPPSPPSLPKVSVMLCTFDFNGKDPRWLPVKKIQEFVTGIFLNIFRHLSTKNRHNAFTQYVC